MKRVFGKNEVGIEDSYARKLREIYKDFRAFPKIGKLGISFLELYQKGKAFFVLLEAIHFVHAPLARLPIKYKGKFGLHSKSECICNMYILGPVECLFEQK